ncbi:MAG: biosynthetic-type acetolactate synthase large subunit [Syntrophothermus sp.]|uniref:biosynthetic-type acetolactate synthase large subunit n=1 Tax=Syntrophothermus sp. TaxID=2736299 RepID=UPI00257CC404|nr:biosynthetic-type acetolactate synthase large subunit [Syntrophothermus sp.]NSW82624.1 biosynthetic-type acetolactate synthase large subunit [Syntrophothermus sp.]
MRMKGAEVLLRCLKEEGVEVIFGYPGGAVLPIYDALYSSEIKHVLVRHEQGAAHAADAYARVSGKVGVCLATSGPGATNLVTGIATAYMDSVPLVAFTGQVATHLIGRDAFQEADITGITLPITKHNYLVKRSEDLVRVIKEAFYIARTNRPGPVVVDLPRDIMEREMEFNGYPEEVNLRGYRVLKSCNMGQVLLAVEAIRQAERPVIYAGGGVISSGASEALQELAIKMKIPVTTTLMGVGCFPETHYLSLGMLGMHGTRYANYAVSESDLIIAVGVRFDDRVTGKITSFAPHAKVIHIDIDAAEIGKNFGVDIPIVGDVKQVLEEIVPRLEPREKFSEWHRVIDRWKEEFPLTYSESREPGRIKPQYVVEQIYYATQGNAIITTEVGQNQMWAAQFYKFTRPRTFITSGGLGTMGFGLPAAIGAKIARPDMTVIDIAGDGSIQMNIQELCTAVEQRLPVVICILNNQYLGMVRQWQELFFGGRYSYTDISLQPDFVKLAEAYGAIGMRVKEAQDVAPALREAFSVTDRPVMIDFWVEREANVFPMVPPGESLYNMLGGEE